MLKFTFLAFLSVVQSLSAVETHQLYGKMASHFPARNPVFSSETPKKLKKDQLIFVAEIPKGGIYKYELRTSTGNVLMDRALCPRKILHSKEYVQAYPAHYGFSPGRFNIDGDPLDLVVLGSDAIYQKKTREDKRIVRVVGMIKMEECDDVPCKKDADWTQDWKVLAVDIEDPTVGAYKKIDQVPYATLSQLDRFFSNYKGPKYATDGKAYPQTRVKGFLGRKKTLKKIRKKFKRFDPQDRQAEINHCHEIFNKVSQQKPQSPQFDKKYVHCLQRVPYFKFLPDSPDYQYFLKYNAFQLLHKLKYPKPNFEQSLEQMKELKENKQTYYRYVTFDSPAPGTGNAIFEWVKTKNRNKGCPKNFQVQHYEGQPLIGNSKL